jgi:hypothetical protein
MSLNTGAGKRKSHVGQGSSTEISNAVSTQQNEDGKSMQSKFRICIHFKRFGSEYNVEFAKVFECAAHVAYI